MLRSYRNEISEAAMFMAIHQRHWNRLHCRPQGSAAGYYATYYDLLAKATLQHITPENRTYETFRSAQASESLLIN